MGVNTTIFSFVNAALFRPVPFPGPDRLVRVWDGMAVSYPDYVAYRNETDVFSGLTAYAQRPMSMVVNGESERISGEFVAGNYFDVLKVNPILGRGFLPEEDQVAGRNLVAVISNTLWRRRFNADPNIVGKSVTLNQQAFTVVGVMPEKFVGATVITPPDLWIPMMTEPVINAGSGALNSPDSGWLMMMGRLRPESTQPTAQAAVETIATRLHQERRDRKSGPEEPGGRTVAVVEARGLMVPPQGRTSTLVIAGILMTIVSLILLVACANVANMLIARAIHRRKEIAVRLALGAGRWRIVRQMLTESLLLSVMGGLTGLLFALWGTDLVVPLVSTAGNIAHLSVTPDVRVLTYTFVLSLATGLIFGLLPALQSSKGNVVSALKDEKVRIGRTRVLNLRSVLVVSQIAVSVLLLVTAGLFIRNLRNTQHAEPGFETRDGLMASFDLGIAGYNKERGKLFEKQLLERLRTSPQIRSASLAEFVPLGTGGNVSALYIEGEPFSPDRPIDESSQLSHATVSTDYFKSLDIPLVYGRDFNDRDNESSPGVIIVNETLARRMSPDGNAVGKRLRTDSKGDYLEVVGVVRDIKYKSVSEAPLYFAYRPLGQRYRPAMTVHLRAVGDPAAAIGQLRSEVKVLDSNLPLTDVKTMEEHMRLPLAPAKLFVSLTGSFAMLTVLLAAIGLYGVMAYLVSTRTHEIGIRMALGAQTSGISRLILRQGMTFAFTGIALGLLAALASTRILTSLLYGVSATDPATFFGVAIGLAVVALLACYVPARRASKVDPLVALRYE
jgi:predicted permease